MAIVRADLIAGIAADLEEYGEWDTDAGEALDRYLLDAMRDFVEKRPWSFMVSSGSLAVTEGNQGPYTPPAGFKALVPAEAVSRYFDYDRFSVPPTVPDASNGLKYDILWDRVNNKLYFRSPPAAGTYTVYFLREFTATSDLSAWPADAGRFLAFRTMHYALVMSEDTAKQADRFFQRSEEAYRTMLYGLRRGESKQESREPRDAYGFPLAAGYGNEGDGFLGGQ